MNHTVYMSIWQLHGNIPFGAPLCLYLWIDNHTDHLNTSQLHGLCLCELLNWLVFWLVNHTGNRNRIHPLGTLLKLLKTILLPFIARSIFRIIFYLSKTYFHRKRYFKCKHQLCEHRHHMQEYQSHPLQPQRDHFLQKSNHQHRQYGD